MPYIRIVNMHIPLEKTDLVFQCPEYEARLFRERWEGVKNRRKEVPITAVPMPLDGEHDPYRMVTSCHDEVQRMRKMFGDKVWAVVYTNFAFEEEFKKLALESNPWQKNQAVKIAEAEANEKAMAAVATAELVHKAMEMRNEPAEKPSQNDIDTQLLETITVPSDDEDEAPVAPSKSEAKRRRYSYTPPKRTEA